MTTVGDFISTLYARYSKLYGDDELAAVATQVTFDDLLRARRDAARRRRAG